MSDASIRSATAEELESVLGLWRAADAPITVTDAIEPLRALLSFDPGALLVADGEGLLVGSLIAAWNGWRGSFYRLAVHPDHRRRGIATRLVREGEARLCRRGAVRLDAIVAPEEAGALAFWNAAGYGLQQDRRRFVRNIS